jgi:hypothetical protein
MKKPYLICFLQHREVNYSLTAFLHLHAALHKEEGLRAQCKIIFACTTHDSPELHNLKKQFDCLYDIDIFECAASYPNKIEAIFSQYSSEDYPYFIKHDEDIFISANSWISLLSQSAEVLRKSDNLLTTVNLTTGIPSWHKFSQSFFTELELNRLLNKLIHSRVPNRFWGNDYSMLNEFISTQAVWDEDGYWERMNSLGYHYRGLHPVRVELQYPIFINQIVLARYKVFQDSPIQEGYKQVDNRYLCNSFFCIKYDLYKNILADESLYVDIFDEVSLNRYAQNNKLNFCFINGAWGIHLLYNSIYDQIGEVDGKTLDGRQVEEYFLDKYTKSVIEYLEENDDTFVHSVFFYRAGLIKKFRKVLRRYQFITSSYGGIKRVLNFFVSPLR